MPLAYVETWLNGLNPLSDEPWVWPHRGALKTFDNTMSRNIDHFALEAWGRMTDGGLKVPCLPGYPYAHAIEKPTLTCAFIADFGPSEWT